jgi:hypothetical protein
VHPRLQLACAWSGIAFIVLLGLGWALVARFFPPQSPSASAAVIAAFYHARPLQIRTGMLITMMGAMFYLPWTALIAVYIAKIEGKFPILAIIQAGCGTLMILAFGLPPMIWATIAFRPDRPPDITQAMNDFAWFYFIAFISPFVFIPICIAIAAFIDKSVAPMFPRWCGYFNIWFLIFILPGAGAMIFKTGVLAWNGVFSFYIPLTVFFIWFVVMFLVLTAGIKRQARAEALLLA